MAIGDVSFWMKGKCAFCFQSGPVTEIVDEDNQEVFRVCKECFDSESDTGEVY